VLFAAAKKPEEKKQNLGALFFLIMLLIDRRIHRSKKKNGFVIFDKYGTHPPTPGRIESTGRKCQKTKTTTALHAQQKKNSAKNEEEGNMVWKTSTKKKY